MHLYVLFLYFINYFREDSTSFMLFTVSVRFRISSSKAIFYFLFSFVSYVLCLENGLARTPPMGWLSWERFRCIIDCDKDPKNCISQQLFKTMADLLASEGYSRAGYVYLVIDDCWMAEHRVDNQLMGDPKRFPKGMKDLADFVHSRELKFGIYGDFGKLTCAGFPGSQFHLETDAETFASWGADYVKFDGCYSKVVDMDAGYSKFGRFLNATGRPMVYSCSWPYYQHVKGMLPNYTAIAENCNLWRNFDDIQDSWRSVSSILAWYGTNQDMIIPNAGPGHWNDPDMLIVGNYGLTVDQAVAQMALWAVLAAPLMISADLRTISPVYKKIILNRDVIAVDQDELGIQGRRIYSYKKLEIWRRPILPMASVEYSYAIAFLNLRDTGEPSELTKSLKELGLDAEFGYLVKDLFDGIEYGVLYPEYKLSVRINPCGAVLIRAIVQPPVCPHTPDFLQGTLINKMF